MFRQECRDWELTGAVHSTVLSIEQFQTTPQHGVVGGLGEMAADGGWLCRLRSARSLMSGDRDAELGVERSAIGWGEGVCPGQYRGYRIVEAAASAASVCATVVTIARVVVEHR